VRVDPDCEAHIGPQTLELCCLGCLLLIAGREDDERALDAPVARAFDDGLEVVGEGFVGEMAVGIDHVTGRAFRAPAAART